MQPLTKKKIIRPATYARIHTTRIQARTCKDKDKYIRTQQSVPAQDSQRWASASQSLHRPSEISKKNISHCWKGKLHCIRM